MVKHFVAAAGIVLGVTSAVAAQAVSQETVDEQVRARQRIVVLEEVLERAVLNGADNVIRQVRAVMPDPPMLAGAPRVRGFRLDNYGVFFDVEVPILRLPILWPLRQMVQESQNRDAMRVMQSLQTEVQRLSPGPERARLEQIARQMEDALGISQANMLARVTRGAAGGVSAATVSVDPAGRGLAPARQPDPVILDDPEGAYTREVKAALIDAMLESSGVLSLGPEEWLTIAARDNAPRDPLVPGDTIDFSTWVFRVKGSDLAAFRSGRITIEEARTLVQEREQ